jgi:hypothetical protein
MNPYTFGIIFPALAARIRVKRLYILAVRCSSIGGRNKNRQIELVTLTLGRRGIVNNNVLVEIKI